MPCKRASRRFQGDPAWRETAMPWRAASTSCPRAAAVFRLYREESLKQGIPPVGERTFYRERATFEDQQVDTLRRGKRATYQSAPFFWALDQTTPRHGGRPFA